MHKWETASEQDIQYIVSRPNLDQMGKLKFYVLRGQNTLFGHLNVAAKAEAHRPGARFATSVAGHSWPYASTRRTRSSRSSTQ